MHCNERSLDISGCQGTLPALVRPAVTQSNHITAAQNLLENFSRKQQVHSHYDTELSEREGSGNKTISYGFSSQVHHSDITLWLSFYGSNLKKYK